MGFAEDQVKKYISNNLRKFHRIRVDQMLHLCCFTEMDRQKLRACVSREGNDVSVWDFFQHLQCREGWVIQLIDALREDNLRDLAEDIQRVYDSFKPLHQSKASAMASSLPSSGETAPSPLHGTPSFREASIPLSLPVDASQVSSITNPAAHSVGDYKDPIQETDPPFLKSEMVVKPKVLFRETESSRSSKRNAPSASKARAAGEKPVDSQAASSANISPEPLTGDQLGEMPGADTVPDTVPISSNSDLCGAPKWDSRQPRPVCVKNGYFGNVNRPTDNRVCLVSTPASSPGVSSNQPEENSYISSDSPVVPCCPDETQGKVLPRGEKIQAPHGYQNKGLLANPVDAGNTVHLQRLFDVGPEGALGPQERSGQSAVRDFNEKPAVGPTGSVPGHPQRGGLAAAPNNAEPVPEEPLSFTPEQAEVTETWLPNEGNMSHVLRPSRENRVCCSSEDDNMPSKPGVLASVPDEGSARQHMSSQEENPEYSGRSSRLNLSSTFTLGNDPLLVSDLNQKGQSEEMCPGPAVGTVPGRDEASASPPGCYQVDNSIRNYSIHVEENPSADLAAAPNGLILGNNHRSQSPGAFSDTGTRFESTGSPPSCPEYSENPLSDTKVAAATSGTSNNHTLLLVGFIFASVVAVAFALYKKK